MSKILTVAVETADAGMRLDRFLSSRLPQLSRSRLQALIAQGCLVSGGTAITSPSGKVKARQQFTLTIPDAAPSHMVPQAIALNVIYEDEHLLVIDKPAGLTVHPGAGNPDKTLVNALLAHCGDTLSGIGGVTRPGIVHRIDKETSGLLVVAKHDAAHQHLSKQLAERSLKRTYAAIVWGTPKQKQGTITGNIGRSPKNRQKMAVLKTGGRTAVTHYKVVASYPLPVASKKSHGQQATGNGQLSSLIECNLETGRTHQIRVHFAHIGNSLVGDPVYGPSTASKLQSSAAKALPPKARDALLNFKRQALHAKELVLIHPRTGKKMQFEAPLPEDMRELIAVLQTND